MLEIAKIIDRKLQYPCLCKFTSYHRLLNKEVHQLALNNRDPELQITWKDAAFHTSTKRTPIEHVTCFKCQKKGHYQSQCPKNIKKSSNQANIAVEDSENGVW